MGKDSEVLASLKNTLFDEVVEEDNQLLEDQNVNVVDEQLSDEEFKGDTTIQESKYNDQIDNLQIPESLALSEQLFDLDERIQKFPIDRQAYIKKGVSAIQLFDESMGASNWE